MEGSRVHEERAIVAYARPGSQEPRSHTCPSSQGCICMRTRRARRSTSAKRGRCAIACAAISARAACIRRPTRCSTRPTRLEVIVTDSVVEALALENHLIKERSPRYNVLLRDDKNYPYLQLTTNEAFPRVLVARRVERDGTFYAGPFMPASLARRTMGLTHRLFGIRSCNEVITGMRDRPCLEYDIKRCIAPCVAAICSQEQYDEAVQRTQLFFEGKNEELIERLTESMREAAAAERFEEAAHLRDAARTVQTLRDRQQKIATARLGDRDAFGLHMGPAGAVVHVFLMREGRVLERVELAANEGISGSAAEILQASVEQFYEDRPAPAEVHLSSDAGRLRAARGMAVGARGRAACRCWCRSAGEKRGLVELAVRNARIAYQARLIDTGLVAIRRAGDAALDAGAAGHSAPHRVLRHLDDPGERDRGVDGRVRRRPDAEERLPEVPHLAGRITPGRTISPR